MAVQLDNQTLRAYISHLGHAPPADEKLHLVGFRSASPYGDTGTAISIHDPEFDTWDDACGYFGTALQVYKATTDPGSTFTKRPMNPKGAAHLLALENGGKPWSYQFGLHKGKPALVQAAPVTVIRDRDRDGTAEASERQDTGWFAVNFHVGGRGVTVGAWSAGCQVLPAPGWNSFYAACKSSGQTTFAYYLLLGASFGSWFDNERGSA